MEKEPRRVVSEVATDEQVELAKKVIRLSEQVQGRINDMVHRLEEGTLPFGDQYTIPDSIRRDIYATCCELLKLPTNAQERARLWKSDLED